MALATNALRAGGQGLPFKVTVIDWEEGSLARQQRVWRNLPGDREVLVCVERWRTVAVNETVDRVIVEQVRAERAGGATRIADVGTACLAEDGGPLPMFHTHSDGNCQFSPADLVTIIARRAPFEGVQCGQRHFVWEFAWKLAAVAATVERDALSGVRGTVPR